MAADTPLRTEVTAGLERAKSLLPGTGTAELVAAITHQWGAETDAILRGEVAWKPKENVSLFGFAQSNLQVAQAGLGARLTW